MWNNFCGSCLGFAFGARPERKRRFRSGLRSAGWNPSHPQKLLAQLMKKAKKGKLFVISAPSGSGKTTLCQKLLKGLTGKKKLARSVSATTRKPRKGERRGKDYFFISKEEFIKRRRRGEFLEWAKVLDNFYGTPRAFVQRQISRGRDVLLSIDVQGARKIKRSAKHAVFIFIMPPSFDELERRLQARSTEDKHQINQRLKLARKEMALVKEYDYVVLNDKLSKAQAKLKKIIRLERGK